MPERWVLPEGSPLYPTLPYVYEQYRRLSVYFRAPEEAVRQILPAPLEYVSDVAEAFILSVPQVSGLVPYSEGGIVVTARYRDIVGGHVAYEYVENDDSLAAGREIWGYPKKLAAVGYREGGERVEGSLRRRGVRILNAEAVLDGSPIQPPRLLPRLVVRRIPRVDGPGLELEQVILNDLEGTVAERRTGRGHLAFEASDWDPLYKLGPLEVLGAALTVGSFVLTYGKELSRQV